MLLQQPVVKSNRNKRIFISVGERETPDFGEGQNMVAAAERLAEKLQSLSKTSKESASSPYQIHFSVIRGASHATAFPTAAIQGLDWLLQRKEP